MAAVLKWWVKSPGLFLFVSSPFWKYFSVSFCPCWVCFGLCLRMGLGRKAPWRASVMGLLNLGQPEDLMFHLCDMQSQSFFQIYILVVWRAIFTSAYRSFCTVYSKCYYLLNGALRKQMKRMHSEHSISIV